MPLSFLDRRDRRTIALALAALTLLGGGWKLRDMIGNAQAAEVRVHQLERRVDRIDKNVLLLLDHAHIQPVADEPQVQESGVSP